GADEFYWADLVGASVVNRDGVVLGTVAGLIDTGPHSVLRVAPEGAEVPADGEERLIPFVSAYVDAVDIAGRRITVDWGLDY
ncbi:MAG: ribosome maturation factor RimM, partial [Caldimonas sp.]